MCFWICVFLKVSEWKFPFILFNQNATYSKCVCVFTQKLPTFYIYMYIHTWGDVPRQFSGKYVLPLPYEYVLGERDVPLSVRPQNAIPINIFVILYYIKFGLSPPVKWFIMQLLFAFVMPSAHIYIYILHIRQKRS